MHLVAVRRERHKMYGHFAASLDPLRGSSLAIGGQTAPVQRRITSTVIHIDPTRPEILTGSVS
jgi:hypothetical protein